MTDIILKQGTGVPSDTDLEVAEVAIDTSTGDMYTKLSDGSIKNLNPEGADGGTGSGGSIQDGDTEGQITTWNGSDWTPESAVVVKGGNVGIGKAPSCALNVANNDYVKVIAEDVAGTATPFSIGSGANAVTIANNTSANTADEAITLNQISQSIFFNTAGTERMRIDASGNVGIGTDTPEQPMHVHRDSDGTALLLTRSTDGKFRGLSFTSSTAGGFSGAGWTRNIASGAGVHAWAVNGDEKMRIDSSGNVGIGMTPAIRTAKEQLAEWKVSFDARLKEEPKADKKAVTLEITDDAFEVLPTEEALAEWMETRAAGDKLQVAGRISATGMVSAGLMSLSKKDGTIGRTGASGLGLYFEGGSSNVILPTDGNGDLKSNGPSLGNGTRNFNNAHFSGTVNANKFVGDGSGLTNLPSSGGGKTYTSDNGITVNNSTDKISMSGTYKGELELKSTAAAGQPNSNMQLKMTSNNGVSVAMKMFHYYDSADDARVYFYDNANSANGKVTLGDASQKLKNGWFAGTVNANKIDAAMAVRSSTLTGGVVGGFYSDTTSSSTGNTNANLKSWSKTGTGKSEGYWVIPENLFAGNAFASGSSTGSSNKGVSTSLAGAKLFESRGLQQYNTSGVAFNGIAVLMCMIDHGFDTLSRMTPEQEEVFKRNEEIRQRLIDNPMERVDEGCQDCWVHETAEGKVALLIPVVADYDFACSSHGQFNLIKKTRGQLPDLNELFDLWRLDGTKIVVDVDQAREYAKGVLRHEARFRFCHAEADDFLFGVSRKGEMRDMVQGLMAEIDKADLAALDNLVGRLRNDGSETYAFKEYSL